MSRQLLADALSTVQGDSGCVKVLWLPAYGAAVMGLGDSRQDSKSVAAPLCELSTIVVALDAWQQQMHW